MKLSIMAKLLTMVVAVVVLSGVSIFLTSHYFMPSDTPTVDCSTLAMAA